MVAEKWPERLAVSPAVLYLHCAVCTVSGVSNGVSFRSLFLLENEQTVPRGWLL